MFCMFLVAIMMEITERREARWMANHAPHLLLQDASAEETDAAEEPTLEERCALLSIYIAKIAGAVWVLIALGSVLALFVLSLRLPCPCGPEVHSLKSGI